MAKKQDYMGLGMGPFLAERIADCTDAIIVTGASGTSGAGVNARTGAYIIGRSQFLLYVYGSNAGKACLLPPVGGDSGCLLGDPFVLHSGADANGSLTVYGQAGTTIIQSSSTISGSLGVSISSGFTGTFWTITPSTWIAQISA